MKALHAGLSLVLCAGAVGSAPAKPSYRPAAGYVPDAKTAVRIAEAVWTPIYGQATIQSEKPFHATLSRGVWTVTGTLPRGKAGGVALAEISRRDGRVLRVTHGK